MQLVFRDLNNPIAFMRNEILRPATRKGILAQENEIVVHQISVAFH